MGIPVRDQTYRLVIAAFRGVFALLGLRFDVRGADRVPATGAAVIASNHIGYLDFTFVGLVATRRERFVRFMAKSSVFDNPVSGPLMRAMRHIPVARDGGAGAYRQALRELEAGQVVGVFCESTISRSWMLKPFARGAAGLSLARGVPLLPVALWGGHRVLTVDGRWSLRRGKTVMVLVGEPIVPGPGDSIGSVLAELQARIAELLERAQREYPDGPSGPRDRWWLPRALGGTAPAPAEAARLDEQALARAARRGRRRRGR